MSDQRPLRSDMGWSTPDKIVVKGFDLTKDLLGKIDLGAMAFLSLVPPYNTEARRMFTTNFRARAIAALDDLDAVDALRAAVA